jgi:hypothetical protein
MAKRISIKHLRRTAPEWVFQWKRPENPLLWKVLALLVAGGFFTMLLTTVKLRVSPSYTWAAPKASVMQAINDDLGRALTQRAREGGPFPSRFEPAEWEGSKDLEQAVMAATISPPPAYVAGLRELPDAGTPSLRLAPRGEPVFPRHRASGDIPAPSGKPSLMPVLYPLAGIGFPEIPRELPQLETAADDAMTAGTWRFLIRLDAAGQVTECLSLAGGGEAGLPSIEAWLRRVTFPPTPRGAPRWVGLGVGFTNQPSTDGTDAH